MKIIKKIIKWFTPNTKPLPPEDTRSLEEIRKSVNILKGGDGSFSSTHYF